MSSTALTTWLGPVVDDLAAEQIERLAEIYQLVSAHYPDDDEYPQRDAAMSAAVQYMLGEITPRDAAQALTTAVLAESAARAAAVGVAITMVRIDGAQKARAAREAGIDRMALLTALGERAKR